MLQRKFIVNGRLHTCMASHVLSKKTANSADFFFSTFIKPVAVKSHNAYQTSCTKTAERDGVHSTRTASLQALHIQRI